MLAGFGAGACALCACGGGEDLSTQQLSRVVNANRPALEQCYDAALEKHPYKQEMRLEAIIHVAPSGRVSSVELEGGEGLPGMGECLRAAIRGWTFPNADAATHTSLPLIFKPEVVKSQPDLDTVKEALRQVATE